MDVKPAFLYRQIYWLPGEIGDIEQRLVDMLPCLPKAKEAVLVSNRSWIGLSPVLSRDTVKYLGTDTNLVIYDAYSGFNPNTFAQICGTLRGGGILILLSPAVDRWSAFSDPEYSMLCGSRYSLNSIQGYFLQRLTRVLVDTLKPINQVYQFCNVTPPSPVPVVEPFLSHDQHQLVNSLVKRFSLSGTTEVITADRGRGKSTSLGIAIARLCRSSHLNVCVTAPHRAAVQTLFCALQRLLPDGQLDGSGFRNQNLSVRYYPPTVLLSKKPFADLVVIDEAAALSVNNLKAIFSQWQCCWFATTLHGYEGNGQGFKLRFFDHLERTGRNWNHSFLTTPVRWAEADPLENLSYKLLLLDADVSDRQSKFDSKLKSRYVYRSIVQKELCQDEHLLRKIFGLLITAHYKTTPNDLRQLLDSPDLMIRLIESEGVVVAVALLVCEGPLASELAQDVWRGLRRPKGDLVPQTWVAKCGFLEASDLQGWRVMRIAVQPVLQSQGLGSLLLKHIIQEAKAQELDFVGAAFAASTDLLRFWFDNGFWLNRLSERQDSVTAQWPALVCCPLSCKAAGLVERAEQRTEVMLMQRQFALLPCYDNEIALLCMSNLNSYFYFDDDTKKRIEGFAYYQRSLEDTLPELRQLIRYRGRSVSVLHQVATWPVQDRELLFNRILYMRSEDETALRSGYNGKRLQLKQLKNLVAGLLNKIEK